MTNISAIILAKDSETYIEDCLKSVLFCDEIIVVDDGSTDTTIATAKKYNAKIVNSIKDNFAKKREIGLKHAKNEWVLYIDTDERVSKELKNEIELVLTKNSGNFSAYKIRRKNFYLGKNVWPKIESLERLFRKESLIGWQGILHESPIVKGTTGQLQEFLFHFSHQDLASMLEKTITWSNIEAKLRFEQKHPPIVWWRFFRVFLTGWYNSYIRQQGYKAGTVGIIESVYQGFSLFITYAKLWELQVSQVNNAHIKKS